MFLLRGAEARGRRDGRHACLLLHRPGIRKRSDNADYHHRYVVIHIFQYVVLEVLLPLLLTMLPEARYDKNGNLTPMPMSMG